MEKLSEGAKTVCKRATDRYVRFEALRSKLTPKGKTRRKQRQAQLEAKRLKTIIDFEVAENKGNANWAFGITGLTRLSEDFYTLTEYLEGMESARLRNWCRDFGVFALTPAEKTEVDGIKDQAVRADRLVEIARPIFHPVWLFFVALCHALQEGENELTATDAYWLGLIDEVLGNKDIHPLRMIFEHKDDPPPPPPAPKEPPKDATKGAETGEQETADKRAQA